MHYTHNIMRTLHKMKAQNSKIQAINTNYIAHVISCYSGTTKIYIATPNELYNFIIKLKKY